ncbi:MAG: SURF1 family protein [Rhodobacteraceae bacterium]|nr:SURF1 family protein [Paracoccaceae bacterium]
MRLQMIAPVMFGIIGAAMLAGLGFWQLERLAVKEALLAQIAAEIGADPVDLPVAGAPLVEFQAVRLDGRFVGKELHVLASTRDAGAIYRIISAFQSTGGRRVLVDRGYVPLPLKDAPRAGVFARITGNIRTPDEVDAYTPAPDPAANIWFARDVPAMAAALRTEPLLVILRTSDEAEPAIRPLPLNASGIPNNHLNYAITWFLFALAWLGMTVLWLWRIRQRLK